jgi:hypothetical protein
MGFITQVIIFETPLNYKLKSDKLHNLVTKDTSWEKEEATENHYNKEEISMRLQRNHSQQHYNGNMTKMSVVITL